MKRPTREGAGEGLLSRWARLKRETEGQARGSEADPHAAPVDEPRRAVPAAETSELDEAQWLEASGLPAPEEMTEARDLSAFLERTVPDALRRRALRRLWRVNPTFANLDGLIEYGEDYTNAATVPAIINTAYTVGRGFRPQEPIGPDADPEQAAVSEAAIEEVADRQARDAADTEADASEDDNAVVASSGEPEGAMPSDETQAETGTRSGTELRPQSAPVLPDPVPAAFAPRRMRFELKR